MIALLAWEPIQCVDRHCPPLESRSECRLPFRGLNGFTVSDDHEQGNPATTARLNGYPCASGRNLGHRNCSWYAPNSRTCQNCGTRALD